MADEKKRTGEFGPASFTERTARALLERNPVRCLRALEREFLDNVADESRRTEIRRVIAHRIFMVIAARSSDLEEVRASYARVQTVGYHSFETRCPADLTFAKALVRVGAREDAARVLQRLELDLKASCHEGVAETFVEHWLDAIARTRTALDIVG